LPNFRKFQNIFSKPIPWIYDAVTWIFRFDQNTAEKNGHISIGIVKYANHSGETVHNPEVMV
jgi:hypothetical protein